MKNLSILFKILAVIAITILAATSCSKSDEPATPPGSENLDVAAEHKNLEFDKASAKMEIPVTTNLPLEKWSVQQDEKWFSAQKKQKSAEEPYIYLTVYENTTGAKRSAKISVSTESKKITRTITITQYGNNEVVVDEDIRVKPTSARASEYQDDNQSIYKSLDGDFNTHYHSRWNGTRLPVTLEYYFKGEEVVDYAIYHTRNGNGNFGKLSVYAATDAAKTYEKIGDYDFGEKSSPSKIMIPGKIKPTAIKFEVHSGLSNLVSCAEMEFYRSNESRTLETKLLAVFTDITCSEVKPGVTDEEIDNLGDYFSRVARSLKNGSYDAHEKEFRIRSYEAYSNNMEWKEKLMTNPYSDLDNPTGIAVKPGDEVVICVGETHGNSIAIQNIPEETVRHEKGDYVQPAAQGETALLHEGVNKVKFQKDGQLFVMYNVGDINAPSSKPIKIHIPLSSGTVTGFFDLKEHKTEEKYREILADATHKYFCVRGNTFIFYMHRSRMPSKILGAIELWDNIAEYEQELCGIDEYRGEGKPFNNHLLGMSPEANNGQMFLWASWYRMAFIWTVLPEILVDSNTILKTPQPIWGPGHEMGHCHQDAINFDPSTETSANIFAHYVQERFGKYASLGPGLKSLASLRAEQEHSWYDIAQCPSKYESVNNRMWWQLYVYYQKLGKHPNFYKEVFNKMRQLRIPAGNGYAGKKQIEFAKTCAEVAQEDLTEFFDLWGFFEVINKTWNNNSVRVTREMVDDAKEFMSQFKRPDQPLQYIEDRKMVGYKDGDFNRANIGNLGFFETYIENPKLKSTISAKVTGSRVTVTDGDEAVMIEIRKGGDTGNLVFFSNFLDFTIPSVVNTQGCSVYAVQADHTRKKLATL